MHTTNFEVLAMNSPSGPEVSSESIGILAYLAMRVINAPKGRVRMAMEMKAKSISTCVNTV